MTLPFVDILIFAVIAIFLITRLNSVLGKRTGFEQKPSQGKSPRDKSLRDKPPSDRSRQSKPAQDADDDIAGILTGGTKPEKPAAMSGRGVAAIKRADAGFDEAVFINGAVAAYDMILKAYAAGDTDTLKNLLGYEKNADFADAIRERRKTGESLTIEFKKPASAKIVSASLKEGLAAITVAFNSRQMRVLKDEGGNIIEGDADMPVAFNDRWVFERDISSRDPNWLLVETHDDR